VARIDFAHPCQLAFLDDCGRLCLIGVITRLPVPALPLEVAQLMMAARIVDIEPGETIDISLTMTTPSGQPAIEGSGDVAEIDFAGEFVFIKLHGFPLTEEGLYRFALSVGAGDPVTFEVPVFVVRETLQARLH